MRSPHWAESVTWPCFQYTGGKKNYPLPARLGEGRVKVLLIYAPAAVASRALFAASAQLLGRFFSISMSLKMLLSRAPCSLTHWAMAVMPSSSVVLRRLPNTRSHLL